MTDRTLSLRVSEELHRALNNVAHEHRTDVAKVVRPHLRDLALEGERDKVADHLLDQLEREQLMEQNAPKWDRIHFPSRVSYQFKQAFENGDLSVSTLGDHAVEEMREIYCEEARRAYDDEELQQAAVEFVEAVADHAAEAADATEFGKLDPEEMFDHYAGVKKGRTRQGVEWERLVDDARDRLDSRSGTGTSYDAPATRGPDRDAVVRALAKTHGVSEELAEEAVDAALGGDGDD